MKKLLLVLILFYSAASFAQPVDDTTKYSFATYLYGQKFGKAIIKDILNMPYQDTGTWRPQTPGAIVIRPADGLLYTWNGIAWSTASGGGGSGTVTSISAINATGQTWSILNPTTTPLLSLGLTSAAVGLGNVNNTSDANKPLSSATITALALKQPLDADLTDVAGLSPSANDILQYKSGAWANRSIAQLKTDLAYGISDITNLQSTIDAKVADAINDGTTTIAPSQNAVFDALALKQNNITLTTTGSSGAATLISNTLNIPQYAGGVSDGDKGSITVSGLGSVWAIDASAVTESMFGLTDVTTANASTSAHGLLKKLSNNAFDYIGGDGNWSDPNTYQLGVGSKMEQSFGSAILFTTLNRSISEITLSLTLGDGVIRFTALPINKSATLTGIKFYQGAAFAGTGDQTNNIGLYSSDGTTLTLVANCTADVDFWKGTSNTWITKPFTSTYAASAGRYYVACLYNSSAQTTAPGIGSYPQILNAAVSLGDFSSSQKLMGITTGSQNTLPATILMTSVLASGTSAGNFMGAY